MVEAVDDFSTSNEAGEDEEYTPYGYCYVAEGGEFRS